MAGEVDKSVSRPCERGSVDIKHSRRSVYSYSKYIHYSSHRNLRDVRNLEERNTNFSLSDGSRVGRTPLADQIIDTLRAIDYLQANGKENVKKATMSARQRDGKTEKPVRFKSAQNNSRIRRKKRRAAGIKWSAFHPLVRTRISRGIGRERWSEFFERWKTSARMYAKIAIANYIVTR